LGSASLFSCDMFLLLLHLKKAPQAGIKALPIRLGSRVTPIHSRFRGYSTILGFESTYINDIFVAPLCGKGKVNKTSTLYP
jgi:hypothetical protein